MPVLVRKMLRKAQSKQCLLLFYPLLGFVFSELWCDASCLMATGKDAKPLICLFFHTQEPYSVLKSICIQILIYVYKDIVTLLYSWATLDEHDMKSS